MVRKRTVLLLLLVCALAFALRFPGVFWGFHIFGHPKFIEYDTGEPTLTGMATEFTSNYTNEKSYYPKGFALQMAAVASLFKPFGEVYEPQLAAAGRLLSVLYGTLSVALLFFLVRTLTSNTELALLSSLFFSLVQTHVNYSHVAVTDAGLLFWVYASIYSMFLYVRSRLKRFFIFALLAAGMALSFKMAFVVLIPVVYVLVKDRWDWKKAVMVLALLGAVFFLANGGKYTFNNFLLTLHNVASDNISARSYNKLINLYCYPVILLTVLGLPVLYLIFRGVRQGAWRAFDCEGIERRDVFFIWVLPLAAQFISVFFLSYADERHIMLLFPLLSFMAAYGFLSLGRWPLFSRPARLAFVLGCFVGYQMVFLLSQQYNFVFDSRETAASWIKQHIPSGEKIALPMYSDMPNLKKGYKIVPMSQADYIVLYKDYYARYLRSIANPFEPYPRWENVFHPDREGFRICQGIFKGELPYKLVKRIHGPLDPLETVLLNKVFGSFGGYDDILIYKKDLSAEGKLAGL